MLIVTKVEEKGVIHIFTRSFAEHHAIADLWTCNRQANVVCSLRDAGQILTAHGAFPLTGQIDKAIAALEA